MSEEGNQVRHSNRQRRVNEKFQEVYQELKGNSNKKFNQKLEKYQNKKSVVVKSQEYDFQTEWLNCLYPHDNGQTFELKIQFCVLKPKKPIAKKKKEPKEEGIMSMIQSLLTNMGQPVENAKKQHEFQIQSVTPIKNGIVVQHPYFKRVEYLRKKSEQQETVEIGPELEELSARFKEIKKSFKPLILF